MKDLPLFVRAAAIVLALGLGLGLGLPPGANAATPAATPASRGTVAAEINGLIKALGESGCTFQRNGSWHDATEARDHLRRKYEWMRDRGKISSAEQFIRDGASRSSMTGREYQVRCYGQADLSAAAWLTAQLRLQRRAASHP